MSPGYSSTVAFSYVTDALHRQGRPGREWNYRIKAVYGVFFINERLPEVDKLIKHVGLADRDTGEPFLNKLRLTYISLPYMTKGPEECETDAEKWIYVLKNLETLDMIPFKDELSGLSEFEARARYSAMSQRERDIYDRNLKNYRDTKVILEDAEERGERRGEIRGEKRGILMSARKLLQAGMSKIQIGEILGLSETELAGI